VGAGARPDGSDPDFRIVHPGGSRVRFPAVKASRQEAFESMTSLASSTTRTELTLLLSGRILRTRVGTGEFEVKKGEMMEIDSRCRVAGRSTAD